jgi:hypothetical protein
MKTLSVLFTFALFVAANALATQLKHAHALPVRSTADHSNPKFIEHNQ